VPIDDYNTLHFTYGQASAANMKVDPESDELIVRDLPWKHDDGRLVVETVLGTDMMAWVTQGPLTPRNLEHLGVSDRGIILYRSVLSDAIDAVARGEDPPGLVRDPKKNEVIGWRKELDMPQGSLSALRLPGQTQTFRQAGDNPLGLSEERVAVSALTPQAPSRKS